MTLACTCEVWDSTLTSKLADVPYLPPSNGQQVTVDDPVGDTGTIQLAVGIDEPAAEFVVHDNFLRFYVLGTPIFLARIEAPLKTQHVTIDGQAKQVITVNSRGWSAMGALAPIKPYGGVGGKPQSLNRPMSAGSPENDLSFASPAVVLWDQVATFASEFGDDPPWFWPWYPPRGWPDKTAQIISCRTYDPDGDGQPAGDFHAWKDIDFPSDGLYMLGVAADDGFELEVDGIQVGSGNQDPGDSFVEWWSGCWDFTAGTHRIHLTIHNYARPVDPDPRGTFGRANRGYFLFCAYSLPNGAATELTDDLLIAHSDGTWVVTDYGVTPGSPTVGVQARTFLTEDQADGMLAGVTLTCTDTHDSAGVPWANTGDQVYSTDNDTFLSFLQSLFTNGLADWHQRADGLAIDLFNYGTNTDHDASFDVGSGLQDLAETTTVLCNSLQVRYKDGLTVVEDADSIATLKADGTPIGRKQQSISLATLTLDAASAQAQAILAERATPTSSWTAQLEVDPSTTDAPYGDGGWGLLTSPTFAGDRLRVMRISTTADEGGNPTFTPELESRLQSIAERQEIWLSNGAPGMLAGTSRAATPLEGMDAGITAGFVQLASDDPSQQAVVPTTVAPYNLTPPWSPSDYPVRIDRIDLRQDVVNTTNPTSIDVIVTTAGSGSTTLFTLTLGVGKQHTTALPGYGGMTEPITIDPLTQSIQFEFTDCDPSTGDDEADARYLVLAVQAVTATAAAVTPASKDTPW